MATVPLADVLWKAANEHLWDGKEPWLSDDISLYSCWATDAALRHCAPRGVVYRFFLELGCDPQDAYTFHAESGPKRQGARYMWLLLAMHVAEDEGIMVEVA